MSEFRNKVVVVTGGANGIGKCIAEEFKKQGALVEVIDKAPGNHYIGDISDTIGGYYEKEKFDLDCSSCDCFSFRVRK